MLVLGQKDRCDLPFPRLRFEEITRFVDVFPKLPHESPDFESVCNTNVPRLPTVARMTIGWMEAKVGRASLVLESNTGGQIFMAGFERRSPAAVAGVHLGGRPRDPASFDDEHHGTSSGEV